MLHAACASKCAYDPPCVQASDPTNYTSVTLTRICFITLVIIFGLGSFAWELSLGSFAWELSFGIFRFEAVAWKLSLTNFRFGTFALDLSRGNFRLGTFA